MKTVIFNTTGGPLWVAIAPAGLYAISFTFRLLESDAVNTPPFILTEPSIAGDNHSGQPKYYYPVVNSFVAGEPLANYDGRYASSTFFIKSIEADNGYNITLEVLQGADAVNAVSLGSDTISGTVGTAGYKEAEIKLQLAKK
jgi:hypothetical protein